MAKATAAKPWSPHYTKPETIDVGGLEVAYRRKGSGPATVFLHGAGGTRMWLPFYERLSESVDLIAPEHPGFGDTPAADWVEGFDDLVLHYRDVLDALELDRVHLIGFSLGGWIAANVAIFYPEPLKSLTLISPAACGCPGRRWRTSCGCRRSRSGTPLQRTDPRLPRLPPRPARHRRSDPRLRRGLDVREARLEPPLRHRARPPGPEVTMPALVIEPDDDRVVPNAHAKRWAELLPNARLSEGEGRPGKPTGHLLMIQQPDATAAPITRFIEEVEG